jgi:hypothetical protein
MKESPFKTALILMAIPLIFGFPLWEMPIKNLINLVRHPSIDGIFNFIFEWHFMFLIVIYLCFVLIFYIGKLREQEEICQKLAKQNQEQLDFMNRKQAEVIEGQQPKNN